jgi:hypothetical protein
MKIKLTATSLQLKKADDTIVRSFLAGSASAISQDGNNLLIEPGGFIWPLRTEITEIKNAAGETVTVPVTDAAYNALIIGYLEGIAATGGGGGGSVTVTNYTDISGTAGDDEINEFPDTVAAGSGLRKLLYAIMNFVSNLTMIGGAVSNNAMRVRPYAVTPIAIAVGPFSPSSIIGGSNVTEDAAGVLYTFSSSGNSGTGILTAYYSPDGGNWLPALMYYWGNGISEGIQGTLTGASLNTYNRKDGMQNSRLKAVVSLWDQMRYIKKRP